MKRITSLFAVFAMALMAHAQFNIQLHYDFGRTLYKDYEPGRQIWTTTLEFFKADRLGSTYMFVDMDYRGKGDSNRGAIGAYWEIGRDFNIAKLRGTNSSFTGHIEYDGGLNNGGSFQQALLVGPAYQYHSNDFSKTFTLQVLYKQFLKGGGCDAVSSFQITPVWGITFCQNLFTFSGFADLWYGYIPKFKNGEQEKGLVFLTEPQLWVNVFGKDRQNNRISVGTEIEMSNNFIWHEKDRSFYVNPTLAVKYTF